MARIVMFALNKEAKIVEEEKGSKLVVKLSIKGKSFEISTEGKMVELYKELDALAQFVETFSKKLGLKFEATETQKSTVSTEETALNTAEIPLITPSKNVVENMKSLFNTPWGKTPRKNAEVAKALEVNAVPIDIGQTSNYLTRLVKKGYLRRIERDGQYHYYKVPEQPNPAEN